MSIRPCLLCLLCVVVIAATAVLPAAEPIFVPVKIDGPPHDPANHSFWYGPFSECSSVADFDGDGDLDIAAGRNWYEAPDWKKHKDFRDGAEANGPETDNNSEFVMDVNRDGRPDIVSSGWMRMKAVFWYENPGNKGDKWKGMRIHAAHNLEGVIHGDIDGDGDEDILCNHWAPHQGQEMTWLEHIDEAPWLVEHRVGTDGEFHGNGLGDVNGDGRCDIVTPLGWYQGPANATEGKWTFHADYTFHRINEPDRYIPASHPILVHDVDEDGLNDLIIGASHEYGLAWLKQTVVDGERSFEQIWVETDFGQFHTMALGDLNGDGKADLVSGKRLFAHHGRDATCYEPLFAFWYDLQRGKFERHVLSYNHLPWYPDQKNHNPPPNGAIAVGMKLNIADMDKDGHNDIVIAGKGGLYVFYRKGSTPRDRGAPRLSPEKTYPSWIQWTTLFDELAFTLVPDQYGKQLKTPDGRTVFRYMTKKPKQTNLTANSVCCLYPVFTPSGLRAVDFAPGDHRHHRGVFLAWHFTEGQKPADFWGWGEMAPTEDRVIKNKSVELVEADAKSAKLAVRNEWMIGEDVMIEEVLSIDTREEKGAYVIDMAFELTPKVDVTLKQTAFGGFCVKGRKEGKSYYTDAKGKVSLPNPHHLKPETDWPGVDWYDFTVDIADGQTVGVTVVDHPKNPPSTWHNLDPIAMVNPCIVAPGAVKLPVGEPLLLRYRLVVHDGPPAEEFLERLSAEFRGQ